MKLSRKEIKPHLKNHIPHRLNLLLSYSMMQNKLSNIEYKFRNNINFCMIEMSMVSARMFIEFLGFYVDPDNQLKSKTNPKKDDVNLDSFDIEPIAVEKINKADQGILIKMYRTANKSVAHLTSSDGDYKIFEKRENMAIILRLLDENLYKKLGIEFPIDIDLFVQDDSYYWSYSEYSK